MKKAEVLKRLDSHVQFGQIRYKGEIPFARFFYWWLDRLIIPADQKYDFFLIDPHLPQLAVNAWESMRTGMDVDAIESRHRYEVEIGRPMVRLMDLDEDILSQSSAISCITCVLQAVVSNGVRIEVENAMDAYCRAQQHTIQGVFDRFLREVYAKGLFEIISTDSARGMDGRFGVTELRTYVMAGRIMFTFARSKKKGKEVSITFISGDEDALGLEAGLQSCQATLSTAMDMIEEVIRQWPKKREKQVVKFRANQDVAPDVVHVMRAQQLAEA